METIEKLLSLKTGVDSRWASSHCLVQYSFQRGRTVHMHLDPTILYLLLQIPQSTSAFLPRDWVLSVSFMLDLNSRAETPPYTSCAEDSTDYRYGRSVSATRLGLCNLPLMGKLVFDYGSRLGTFFALNPSLPWRIISILRALIIAVEINVIVGSWFGTHRDD